MIVDLVFPVIGTELAVDHSYSLFSALSHKCQAVHNEGEIGIFPISGIIFTDRRMRLTDKSILRIRLPTEKVKEIYTLSGQEISIRGDLIRLGIPNMNMLQASRTCYSRIVVISKKLKEDEFLESFSKLLKSSGVTSGVPELIEQPDYHQNLHHGRKFVRRTINVKGHEIVGFPVRIKNLENYDSLIIQEKGIGSKRHMGCGLFIQDSEN